MDNNPGASEPLAALSEGMAGAVERIGASVVRVNGRRRRPSSGVIYARDAVLTASHALEREEDVTVGAHDGRTLPARFVGRDPSTDLAVLRVEGLEAAASPERGEPRVGELALAVGRSGREDGPRASLGVVGAVGGPLRTWRGGRLERYIATDARPYPGLSGGALVSARSEVLGILTASPMRGVALAVPAELAWRIAGSLEERGSVRRGYLGVLSQPVRLPDGLDPSQGGGLLVIGVEDGSPAGGGGVMIGDILTSLDGQPVEDTEDLLALLAGERVGNTVPVGIIRGGEPRTLDVTVGERG
jgi:serine protease DegQ